MDLKYKFNATEYATLNRITASALRKRRLSGKLEGQYIKKGSEYFYSTPLKDRPNKDKFPLHASRSNNKRRQVPEACTRYHNARNGHQLKLANDIKQLARINRSLNENQIAEITPDIIEVAKHYGLATNSKDGRRMARTMQRMADQFEIIKGSKYGTYIYRDGKDKNGEDIC